MKTFSAICLALLAGELSASAQGQEKKIEVIVENPWNAEKVDEPVVIDLSSLEQDLLSSRLLFSTGQTKFPHSSTI